LEIAKSFTTEGTEENHRGNLRKKWEEARKSYSSALWSAPVHFCILCVKVWPFGSQA
jgi:hypothetical protein